MPSKRASPPKDFEGDQEQFQKFVDAAHELGCDEDEAAFEAKLKKLAKTDPPKDQPKSDDDKPA